LVLGIIGLIAWCLPLFGLPIGGLAVFFGARSLKSEGRTQAIIGLSLGIICLVLSLINAVLGAMMFANKFH
jgi:hypothetical protein